MNTLLRLPGMPVLVVLAALLGWGCSDPEAPDPDPTDPGKKEEITPEGADAFLEGMRFASRTKVAGTVPAAAQTAPVKTNFKDTLYLLPGVKTPIRLAHPATTPLKGVYVAV